MKSALKLLAALLCTLTGASAQNLIVNGDFETGLIAPWSGGSIIGNGTGFTGTSTTSITQTVATTAGARYLVTADNLGAGFALPGSLVAVPTGSGTLDGS